MVSRGIEICKRIMWRLREKYSEREYITKKELRKEIMMEAGIDNRTIKNKIDVLKELKWIRCERRCWFINKEEDYD